MTREPLPPALLDALRAIDAELTDLPADAELAAKFQWVVDVLIMRGHLTEGHRRLLRHVHAPDGGADLSEIDEGSYLQPVDIDCESHLHLCLARCCSFKVPLARSDVAKGRLRWVVEQPYLLPRTAAGYCENLDEDDARCKVYEHRPGPCRVYDCRIDSRVWLDYEQRIPAPMPSRVIPLERLRRRGPPP